MHDILNVDKKPLREVKAFSLEFLDCISYGGVVLLENEIICVIYDFYAKNATQTRPECLFRLPFYALR